MGNVLVVGGGIGGLAAATALAHRGVEVAVLEARPALGEVGAGLTLWPNALAVLARLGVDEAVLARGHEIRVLAVRDRRGRRLSDIATARLRDRLGHPSVGITRPALHDVLVDAARRAGVVIHLDARVVDVAPAAGGARVHLDDGRCLDARLVVGADGLHSAVRRRLHGDAPTDGGTVAWRAVCDTALPASCPDSVVWRGPGSLTGAVRQTTGSFWFVTRTLPADASHAETDPRGLLEHFGGWAEPLPTLIATTPPEAVHVTRLHDRRPRWGRGPVTLLGDAAHPMRPSLGQGACQALEDAARLAEVVTDGRPDPLRRYEAARRRRVARIVRYSRWVSASEQVRVPMAARLADISFALTPARATTTIFERVADPSRYP
jgi:2-polyprenyl-6-methoxyphenol hydroxylase-like FAD-dependent oxidoreductase